MSKKYIDTFLDKMKIKKEENKIDDTLFFEDKFLNRYQEIGLKIKISQENYSGGGKNDYDNFIDNWNNDEFKKQIDTIEKSIYHKHKTIFTSMINKFELKQMVERYVFNKYDFNSDSVFIIGAEMYIEKLKYNGKIYLNTLPKKDNKVHNTYIRIASNFKEFTENIKEMTEFIDYVINNCVKDSGNLIIFCPLLFPNKIFYNYILKIINEFESVEIFYPLYFMNNITNSFIILKNYKGIKKRISSFSDQVLPFFEKINRFLLEEYNIYDNLLTIKYNNETMFDIITKKYISFSMLKYDLNGLQK